jgi:hypothetical protein
LWEACKAAAIGARTAYDERQRNEEFALAWADVIDESTDELEQESAARKTGLTRSLSSS